MHRFNHHVDDQYRDEHPGRERHPDRWQFEHGHDRNEGDRSGDRHEWHDRLESNGDGLLGQRVADIFRFDGIVWLDRLIN
jgi:hypothetical protein